MFPYPSGTAMHVWHVSNFMVNEIVARYHTMRGDNVIFPIGYDSFGLPTENYAIKNNKSAHLATAENITYYNEQLKAIDFMFDEDRKFATSDPEYYRWTQWIFTKLYQHNLVYRKNWLVNWCNGCQTVLANDQVVDGKCERCETEIIQKKHPQRYIKITDYADKLLDYADCDRPEETKVHQSNWIGKSQGCEADFQIAIPASSLSREGGGTPDGFEKITVFTTRIDTIYGVTAIVLAPENEIIDQYMTDEKKSELAIYRKVTALKTNIERQAVDKEKTGFDSGVEVIHPLTAELVPVWFADYVLPDYATGAVMFVPAHDERDAEFAQKYNITTRIVIVLTWQESNEFCYTWSWVLINSDQFNWLDNITAKAQIAKHLESIGMGQIKTTYRLRDWSVSRQRYWGSPIPVYYTFEDNDDGRYTADNPHPDKTKRIPNLIPESDLPVILPLDLPNYKPAGKSPLEDHPSFKYYHAPDGQVYLRECDTLDTFMCSSFYFLRFCDPHNEQELISPEAAKLMPVDLYVGGKEHTVWHLLYSRFIYKFLQEHSYVACESKEPFHKLVHQGMIHAHDGRKMSKRRGNVVDPMTIIDEYGSDTLRVYTMFMWPVEASKNWNPDAVGGVARFLKRVEKLKEKLVDEWVTNNSEDSKTHEVVSLLHQTIRWVTDDIEALKFNTAVSKLMIMLNLFAEVDIIQKSDYLIFLQLLAPFATRMTQQLWQELWQEGSIHDSIWPEFDPSKISLWSIDLPVQINGKMRGTVTISSWTTQDEVMKLIEQHENISKRLTQGQIKKIIYVQDKICNIIIGIE